MKAFNASFASVLVTLLCCNSGAAQAAIECTVSVEYDGTTVRVSHNASSSQTALAKAIDKGCQKICGANAPEAIKSCHETAKLSTVECYDDDGALIEQNREKARAALLSPKSVNKVEKRITKELLLSRWVGGNRPQKERKKKHPLILSDPKSEKPLLLTPSERKAPLLID